MYVVLCHADDAAAAWAAVGLRRRTGRAVEVVLAEELTVGATLVHNVEGPNPATSVVLRDGRVLSDRTIHGVLNRLVALTPGPDVRPADSPYVEAEWTAATVSWIAGLRCPVLNRPVASSVLGPLRRDVSWQRLAAHLGLPTAGVATAPHTGALHGTPERAGVLVVGGSVVDPAALALDRDALVTLAALGGVSLCELVVERTGSGEWAIAGATPMPDLLRFGDACLDALAATLATEAPR